MNMTETNTLTLASALDRIVGEISTLGLDTSDQIDLLRDQMNASVEMEGNDVSYEVRIPEGIYRKNNLLLSLMRFIRRR